MLLIPRDENHAPGGKGVPLPFPQNRPLPGMNENLMLPFVGVLAG